ncbi:hypothetical protein [Taibaiella koreensis]|uniref:hypothetical protein n=1 Tax=Taibaiella koreensis TaxID=1268548 RepID=UPI0013C361AB|nr:hypothetical protein [Taibaiella koreensis]
MKTIQKGIIAAAIFLLPAMDSQAQIYVRIRPPRPQVVVTARPVAPSPRHVWVTEDWVVDGGAYRWHGGYWAAPPRPGLVWARGHWRHSRRGDLWIPGRWR